MSSDELKVPSQRNDVTDDDRRHEGRRADEPVADEAVRSDLADGEEERFARDEARAGRVPGDDEPVEPVTGSSRAEDEPVTGSSRAEDKLVSGSSRAEDEPVTGSPRAEDEYAAAVPGAVRTDPVQDDPDPYARTAGDMLTDPPQVGAPDGTAPAPYPAQTAPTQETPYGETPAHAAPEDIVLFDQDPSQVQARWRDLQAAFVDDPGEAVQRADGLVSEVVDSLTSSLNSRTSALRDRWKGAEGGDTEQLRLALRDYRNVLERLLAISGKSADSTS
jgi:hypothetical protein